MPLPRLLRRFIAETDLGRNEKVFAGVREKIWRRDDGFVTDFWTDLGFAEAWDETQRQPGRDDGILTFYCRGDQVDAVVRHNAAATRDHDLARTKVQAWFEHTYGNAPAPVDATGRINSGGTSIWRRPAQPEEVST